MCVCGELCLRHAFRGEPARTAKSLYETDKRTPLSTPKAWVHVFVTDTHPWPPPTGISPGPAAPAPSPTAVCVGRRARAWWAGIAAAALAAADLLVLLGCWKGCCLEYVCVARKEQTQKGSRHTQKDARMARTKGILAPQVLELLGFVDGLLDDRVGELGHAGDVDAVGLQAGACYGLRFVVVVLVD